MLKVKVTDIGSSMGILLPREALNKMKACKGDTLYLIESPEGYTLTLGQQNLEKQMDVGKDIMQRYKQTLKDLAK